MVLGTSRFIGGITRTAGPITVLNDTDGKKEVANLASTERRFIAKFEKDITRGRIEKVQFTINTKTAGAHPTKCDLYIIGNIEHSYTIQIVGSDDGNYIVTINGTAYTTVASGNTIEEIRDDLITQMAAVTVCTIAASSTDTILLTAPSTIAANTGYAVVTNGGPSSDMTIAETAGFNEGDETIYVNEDADLSGSTAVPDLSFKDSAALKEPFQLYGTAGYVQISILLTTGADGTTDYTGNVQVFVEPTNG